MRNRNCIGLVVILFICGAFWGLFVSYAANTTTKTEKTNLSNADASIETTIGSAISEGPIPKAKSDEKSILEWIKELAEKEPVTLSISLITAFSTLFLVFLGLIVFALDPMRAGKIDQKIKIMRHELQEKLIEDVSDKVRTRLLGDIYSNIKESVENAVYLEVSATHQKLTAGLEQKFEKIRDECDKQRKRHLEILNLVEEAKYIYPQSLGVDQIKYPENIMPKFSYGLFQCLSRDKNTIWTGINTLYTLKDTYKVDLPKAVYNFLKIIRQTQPEFQDNKIKKALKNLFDSMAWEEQSRE